MVEQKCGHTVEDRPGKQRKTQVKMTAPQDLQDTRHHRTLARHRLRLMLNGGRSFENRGHEECKQG